jgi:murein DD-endopeptidase MepM/ murein hydrolase activator NlpD
MSFDMRTWLSAMGLIGGPDEIGPMIGAPHPGPTLPAADLGVQPSFGGGISSHFSPLPDLPMLDTYMPAVTTHFYPSKRPTQTSVPGEPEPGMVNYNRPQPKQLLQTGQGAWDFLVPGGKGRTETGGTHGGHPAVDIFASEGTPIYAPTDGVSSPAVYPLGGNATTIRGDDGRHYYMAHGQRPFVGGRIRRGQIIGYVGRTGNARNTAPHLHYAVASSATYFDRWNGSGDLDPADH